MYNYQQFKLNEMKNIEDPLPMIDGYETSNCGTHVMVLPHEDFLKKHWNKVGYVSKSSDNTFKLHNMSFIGNSNKERIKKPGNYCPIFFSNAIPETHFNWIENSVVYDKFGDILI